MTEQHEAPPTTSPTSRGIFDPELLDDCISCGFCLPACPTYALTQDERSGPRGRITLMRALEEGRLEPDDPTLREQSSFCLGCRACETVCPAGVQYGTLLEQWRDHQWRGVHTPPAAGMLRAGVRVTPGLAAAGRVRGAARTTGRPAAGKAHLMLGCAERALFPGVSQAVLRLLPDAVDVPAGQGCCGALHAHNGASGQGAAMARELGGRMAAGDGDPGVVLTTAGGCAAHLVHVLGRDRVRELSEYLAEQWADGAGPPLRNLGVRAALQDSCHLRNGMGVTAAPRALVARVAEYVELPSAGTCCGAAGTYALLRPEDSRRVLDATLDEIEAAGVDVLVVVNPGCQRQLVDGLRRRRSTVEVLHLAELLARALA